MKTWDDITLFKFQQIEAYNGDANLSELDKILFSVCSVFNLTEYQLDQAGAIVAGKLAKQVQRIFEKEFQPHPYKRIGKYLISYDPSALSFGQYVELMFFLQAPMKNAHYVLASISSSRFRKSDHRTKAAYFLHQPITKITGSLKLFLERFTSFNNEYKGLFGLDEQVHGEQAQHDPFNQRWGWTWSAKVIADHHNITLNQAFEMPIREALGVLALLKAKDKYDADQLKKA